MRIFSRIKRMTSLALALIMAFSVVMITPLSARAEDYVSRNGDTMSSFTITSNTLKKYIGNGGDVIIPEGVKTIDSMVFSPKSLYSYGKYEVTNPLTKLELPSTLTSIKTTAFYLSTLESLTIPDTIGTLGITATAFSGSSLKSFIVPAIGKLDVTGTNIFKDATQLKTVDISAREVSTNKGMFMGATSLESVAFSKDTVLNKIADQMFENCSSLETVVLPDDTQAVGTAGSFAAGPFAGCTSLNEIIFPATLRTIGGNTFRGTSGNPTSAPFRFAAICAETINPPSEGYNPITGMDADYTINPDLILYTYKSQDANSPYVLYNTGTNMRTLARTIQLTVQGDSGPAYSNSEFSVKWDASDDKPFTDLGVQYPSFETTVLDAWCGALADSTTIGTTITDTSALKFKLNSVTYPFSEADSKSITEGDTLYFFANTESQSIVSPTAANFDKKISAQADVAVTMALNGNTLVGITNGAAALTKGTDYTVSGSTVTIKKEYLAAQSVGKTALTFTFSAGAVQTLVVSVGDTTPKNDSTIGPVNASFDKKTSAQADVAVTMALNDNTLVGITNGASALTLGTDYTVSGSTVMIKKEYLAAQSVGTTTLTFSFSAGAVQTLVVSVSDTTPKNDSTISPVNASFDKKASAQADVAVTMALNGNTLVGITNGVSALTKGTDYTVSGSTVMIKKEYLATQSVGTTVLTFTFSAGVPQTLTITVNDTTPKNSAIYPTEVSFDKSLQQDVVITLTLNGNTSWSIKNGGKVLTKDTDYTVTGNTVTLKKEYFARLGKGTVSLSFYFNAGAEQVLTVSVTESTPWTPPTGYDYSTKSQNGDTLEAFVIDAAGMLTEYHGKGGHVVIPEGVTIIDAYVFSLVQTYGRYKGDLPLSKIDFPSSLTEIYMAFQESTLESLFIPDTIEKLMVGAMAFKDAKSLTTVDIQAKNISIGDQVFSRCTALETVAFAKNTILDGLPNQAFAGCSSLKTVTLPDRVESVGGSGLSSIATTGGPFWGCTSLSEIIFPSALEKIGTNTFRSDRNAPETAPFDFVAICAPAIQINTSHNPIKKQDANYTINPNLILYAYKSTAPDSPYVLFNTGSNMRALNRTIQLTVQDGNGKVHSYPDFTAKWDASENAPFTDSGVKYPSFETTVLDSLSTAIAGDTALAAVLKDTSNLKFTLNGETYPFSDAGAKSIKDGDTLLFYVDTGKTAVWVEQNGQKVTSMKVAPKLPYELTLRSDDGPVSGLSIYRAYSDNTPWEPVGGATNKTDANGKITVSFPAAGEYRITPYDASGGSINYYFVTVTVSAPNIGVDLGEITGTPALDKLTPMTSGYMAGEFVKLNDKNEPGEAGFETEHTSYNVYISETTTGITVPVTLDNIDYAGTITLTAKFDSSIVSGFNAVKADATGKFAELSLSPATGNHVLTLEMSLTAQGETFKRTYTINIIRDTNLKYSGIRNLEGVLGLGIGKGTTLVDDYVPGTLAQTAFINPDQTEAVFDVTLNKETELYIGTKETGVLQSTDAPTQPSDESLVTYRIILDCSDAKKSYTITAVSPNNGGETTTYSIAFKKRSAVSGVFTPDKVIDYHPADNQFKKSRMFPPNVLLEGYTNVYKYVELGGFGGYATYYYEEPITHSPNNPYGVDFIVYGNTFAGGMCNEPAGAQVSYDGETWYDLAGQRHYELNTRYESNVPLLEGVWSDMTFPGGVTDSLLLMREGDPGYSGGYPNKVGWGYAEIAASSTIANAEGDDWVTAMPFNPYRANPETNNRGDMFSLLWAVDKTGKPVELSKALPNGIRYIRLQTIIDVKVNGPFGEISPEIGTIVRVNPSYKKADPVGVTGVPTVLSINGTNVLQALESVNAVNSGTTKYYALDLGGIGSTVDVHVEGTASDNIYVNTEHYTGMADYLGMLAGNDDITRGALSVTAAGERTVRVVVQNGEKEPLIYVIRCYNGGDTTNNAELQSLEFYEPATASIIKGDDAIYRATVENYTSGIKLNVAALSSKATIKINDKAIPNNEPTELLPLSVGENTFTVKITSESGNETKSYTVVVVRKQKADSGSTDDSITVSMRLIGSTLSSQDVDLTGDDPNGYHGAEYVTWIPTTKYTMNKDDTVYDVFVRALRESGLDFRIGSKDNYVEAIWAPEVSGGYELAEFTNGQRSGWMYTIGKPDNHPRYGLSEQGLSDGDVIIWHYVNDYSYEVKDWFDEPDYPSLGNGTLYSRWMLAADTAPKKDDKVAGNTTERSTTLNPKVTAKNGVAAASVSATEMSAVIVEAKRDGSTSIVIEPEITGKTTEATVELPKISLAAIASDTEASLKIVTPTGCVTLPNDVLKSIASQASGITVTVSFVAVENKSLTTKQQEIVGKDTVYDITVLSGGKTISSFDGKAITISLPYTLKSGEKAEGVTVWYLNDAGKLERMSGKYDAATKLVTFTTTHLSKYVVGYETPWTNPFGDVKDSDWFYDAVKYAVKNELFTGTSATAFAPNADMTRAMLVTVLYRLEGKPAVTGTNSFTDVQSSQWYTDAVLWASANGIVAGYGNSEFGINDPITREQMATILYRYAKFKGYDVTKTTELTKYTDATALSNWGAEAMKWANATGLITGTTDTTLTPSGSASRAQVATILMRFISK